MQFKVSQGKGLRGDITIPGDKSISHRAVMLASLAEGKSKISGLLEGEDCLATVEVFKKLGVSISKEEEDKLSLFSTSLTKAILVNTYSASKSDCIAKTPTGKILF